ncbi:transmembrane protein 68 [Galendromus occidentalis]|uniref:Transmembrane protein 68 n=1 Tax=Galendromus occidentalis TaxID=34638 RepID=A0AAJ6QR01_9ACAR|nr:transmembrane protein 68 [Galendromus occidentalis]
MDKSSVVSQAVVEHERSTSVDGQRLEMARNDKPLYSDETIRTVHSWLKFTHSMLGLIVILVPLSIWVLSPNNFVAFSLIMFTTTTPLVVTMVGCEISCRLAIALRRKYPGAFTDIFCSIVKFFSALSVFLHGKLFHGHEVHGIEKLPKTSGALVIYAHSALFPSDTLHLLTRQSLLREITFGGVISRKLWLAMNGVCEFFSFYTERDRLVESLKKGHHCAVAPGGSIEAAFSKDYELMWNGRKGFAEVAKECGVPIVPMFTTNSQQAMPVSTFGFRDLFLAVYERTKEHIFVPLICFPVKMRTYFGEPIFCGDDETPEELAKRVEAALYALRDKHQRRPGNVLLALMERLGYPAFYNPPKSEKKS